ELVVFIVAADTLGEDFRLDELAAFRTHVERVVPFDPGDIVHQVVQVLDRLLRRVRVRTEGNSKTGKIAEVKAGKGSYTRERLRSNNRLGQEARVAHTDIVGQVRGEGVRLADSCKVITSRRSHKEIGDRSRGVCSVYAVVDVPDAQRVLLRNHVIAGGGEVVMVVIERRSKGETADRYRRCRAAGGGHRNGGPGAACCVRRRAGGKVLLIHLQVRCGGERK